MLTLLPAADRVATPWKNGGGVTLEVMAFPQGSSLDDFDWRISIAQVASDGPFSHFPGIDRTLCILDGQGIFLDIGGRLQKLNQRSMPFRFSGDANASARLLNGPIFDLNVMSRRGRVEHRVLRLGGGEGRAAEIKANLAIALWASDAGDMLTPEGGMRLGPLDAVLCETPGRWQAAEGGLAYLISLGPTG